MATNKLYVIKWTHASNEEAVLNSIIDESGLSDYLSEPLDDGEEYEITVSVQKKS